MSPVLYAVKSCKRKFTHVLIIELKEPGTPS